MNLTSTTKSVNYFKAIKLIKYVKLSNILEDILGLVNKKLKKYYSSIEDQS